ncbi:hypothetical protein [Thalassotalea castellviae]|uniref:Uncharacterized protein n=1 Tax=Thalassotalea castellviae TaxID=3075612 RepID=A0ABU3A5D6_9GAMM|nr:hypothetical protein [Thalassotalea sp. W431]MDT0605045.1 hypothetical protein [Thalassotalea sp. W431]
MQWEAMIEFLGGATAITFTISFLGKKAIEAFINGRVESYKKNLERIASENSIRFQNLHSERANIIKEFYEKLSSLEEALHSTLKPFQPSYEIELTEKVKLLSIQFNELREYYLPKRIFFEKKLCTLIESVLDTARGVFFDITTHPVSIDDSTYQYDRELMKERHQFWESARDINKNEISKLKSELEDEFRKLLGIYA